MSDALHLEEFTQTDNLYCFHERHTRTLNKYTVPVTIYGNYNTLKQM